MPVQTFAETLSGLMPYGLITVLGLVLAVLASVVIATGRKVNPGLAVFGVGLTALGGALVSFQAVSGIDVAAATAEDFNGLQVAATARFTAWFGMGLVSFCSLMVLAIGGARKEPRDLRAAVAAAAGVALVVVLAATSGLMVSTYNAAPLFYARAFCYAVSGALVVAAMLSGGEPDHPGRTAGAAASVTFALMVSVLETSSRGATTQMLLMNVGKLENAERARVVTEYMEKTGGEVPWLIVTILASMVVGVLGVANAAREKQHQAWAALIWLAVVPPIVWFGGSTSTDTIVQVATALP